VGGQISLLPLFYSRDDILLGCGRLDFEGHGLGVRVGEAQNLANFVGERAWRALSVL
jgi:hypothetical protein